MTDKFASIGLGLIEAGLIGKTHAIGFAAAQRIVDFP